MADDKRVSARNTKDSLEVKIECSDPTYDVVSVLSNRGICPTDYTERIYEFHAENPENSIILSIGREQQTTTLLFSGGREEERMEKAREILGILGVPIPQELAAQNKKALETPRSGIEITAQDGREVTLTFGMSRVQEVRGGIDADFGHIETKTLLFEIPPQNMNGTRQVGSASLPSAIGDLHDALQKTGIEVKARKGHFTFLSGGKRIVNARITNQTLELRIFCKDAQFAEKLTRQLGIWNYTLKTQNGTERIKRAITFTK